jgi:UDP-glucose 4-epimerase
VHVLVTGGAGFIGSHVVERLLAREHLVRVVDDLSSGRRDNVPSGADLIEASVTDGQALHAALDGVDAVVHLAAIASVARSVEAPRETHAVNLAGTIGVGEAAARAGVRKVVYASSAAVYGFTEREAHHEDDATAPATPYAIDKLTGETYLRFFAREHGLDARALRFFNVYGPRQGADSPYSGVIARFATGLLQGQPLTVFGDGGQTRDFVFVGDVADIVVRHVEERPERGAMRVMNVCNGTRTSLLDLIDALAGATGTRPEVRHEGARSGDIRHSRGAPAELGAWYPDRPRTGLDKGLQRLIGWMRAG